jgi:hypothetical protein
MQPQQAVEIFFKHLALLSPEVNAELSMLLAVQLQEWVDTVLASCLAQPQNSLSMPMAATMGITATSNAEHPKHHAPKESSFVKRMMRSSLSRTKGRNLNGCCKWQL